MSDNEHLDIWVKICTQIGELNANIKTALDRLAGHEKRLDDLEKGKSSSWKDDLLRWLVRGIVASILVISSLTGAAGLIKGVFGL